LLHRGRWVSSQDLNCQWKNISAKPHKQHAPGFPEYDPDVFGTVVSVSELCFLEQGPWIGSTDWRDRRTDPYVWQPYDCRYDIMNSVDRLQCLQEKNVSRFLDFGDR
ncbi:unnamed protein product, partial [Choristocarpus tenellus]